MSNKISNNKRIAKNTALLYVRMAVVMLINLYTVRVVLNALGAEDYGIFNVIAGVVTMLSSVTSVLSTATQRYYSYSLGERTIDKLKYIFSASQIIYIVLSLLVIVVGETLGLWFINTYLTIPPDRVIAANWIYQFSLLSFIFSIVQCPYSAAVIAHEDMGYFAAINFSECLLKLLIAVLISKISFDGLIYFGFAMMFVPLFSLIAYLFLGKKYYEECHFVKVKDKKLYKELLSFSGWNLFASLAGVAMNQVINILINIFFGPIANAARAVSMQIQGAMNSFSSCFIMALRPPMTKSYAENDYTYLNKLFAVSNKLIYYCMLVIVIPMYIAMDQIIALWLKTDDYTTTLFARLMVVYITIMVMNNPISIVMQACGKVKEYFVPVETMTILCPFVCYLLFKFGCPAEYSFYSMIFAAIASHIIRIICFKKYYKCADVRAYILGFIVPAVFISMIDYIFVGAVNMRDISPLFNLLILVFVSFSITLISVLLFGLTTQERSMVMTLCNKIIRK